MADEPDEPDEPDAMTARNEMAALLESDSGYRARPYIALDAIARLATDPETASVVFRWLVEAGVLCDGDGPCDCEYVPWSPKVASGPPYDKPWDGHYHAVLGER